jgi:hypothetical protein
MSYDMQDAFVAKSEVAFTVGHLSAFATPELLPDTPFLQSHVIHGRKGTGLQARHHTCRAEEAETEAAPALAEAEAATTAAAAAKAAHAAVAAAVAELELQISEQEMAAEELRVTREAKLEMVSTLQDSWSGRAAECRSKAVLPAGAAASSSPMAKMSSSLRGVRAPIMCMPPLVH